MNKQIAAIHTPCKNCVFSKYEDNTQIDCHLGYIEKYKKNKVEILEAYDNEKEFYIINNKKCIGYRENKWFQKWNLEDNIENKIKKYNESNYAHYVAIINLKQLNLDNLNKICNYISCADIKPQKIVIIRYQNDNKKFKYKDIENILNTNSINHNWRIQTMLDANIEYSSILCEIAKQNKFSRFILSIEEDIDLNPIINYANHTVYNELQNFYACGDSNKKVIMYSSTVFRYSIETKQNITDDVKMYHTI